ncbi:uncharacterized protein E0L32_003253 [Thyridium curvatum]|uniref:Uncharacterized protein n=1 Tax=Thyridium curvatum TaxID=1093900 RepID=A0A507B1Z6_9PEZI|nr:uncharacterized protein E0L32_003253 [Thyridium curvatum]TPX17135.1 hypothetical protein E0L32_003253 [Thyridium curvatum]
MGDSRRKVNFRDSPPGGSRSSRQASDSGVGSLSDPASPRATAAQVTDDQWNDLESLQEAYRSVYKNKEHWKKKAKQSDEEIAELRKALKEREASWRGVVDRNEQLEDEKKKILKDKKSAVEKSNVERQRAEEEKENLEDENKALQDEVALLKRQLKEARRASSPTTSGGSGGETTTKLHRSSSRRDSDKKQKERLKERFESKSSTSEATSDATSLSSKAPSSSTRARRKSYVEPFGPSSPTRAQYATYTTTPIASPLYAYAQEPTFSSVPRTERPTISVTTEQAVPDYYDDYQEPAGYYPPPPLPKQHHSSSRTSRYPR